jgi:hypothetical protein
MSGSNTSVYDFEITPTDKGIEITISDKMCELTGKTREQLAENLKSVFAHYRDEQVRNLLMQKGLEIPPGADLYTINCIINAFQKGRQSLGALLKNQMQAKSSKSN